MQHATRENRETYEACFNPEEQEVTVVRNIWAGICGPAGSYPATDLPSAAVALFAAGYLVGSEWSTEKYSSGRWADLTPMS